MFAAYWPALVAAFFWVVLVTPMLIAWAHRRGWVDAIGGRKVHQIPIPRVGGLALFTGFWLGFAVLYVYQPAVFPVESQSKILGLFFGSALVWFLGIYDDFRGANAWQKIAVQLVAGSIVVFQGVDVDLVINPIGSDVIVLPQTLVWAVSLFWIVFISNAINLIDGLDGLATGVCLITLGTIAVISLELGNPYVPYLSGLLAVVCLAFLIYNFNPARIFLGDSGSLFLGFMLACLSILGTTKRSTAIVMFGPPLILALPVLDVFLAIFRRFLVKAAHGEIRSYRDYLSPGALWSRLRNVFEADQEHIHHSLLKVGLSHRRAVILLYVVTTVLGVTAYQMAVTEHLLSVLIVFSLLALGLFWLRKKAFPRKQGKVRV